MDEQRRPLVGNPLPTQQNIPAPLEAVPVNTIPLNSVNLKPIKDINFKVTPILLKLVGFLMLISPFVMGFGLFFYWGNANAQLTYGLIGSLTFSIATLLLVTYISKKTHALLELKASITGNPISMFFTDNKRVVFKTIKPENEMVFDKQFGTFLANKNGNYIDMKTKNIVMCFNTPLGTSASIEAYALSDRLSKVYRDESIMNKIRKLLIIGEVQDDTVVVGEGEDKIVMKPFIGLRESIDFSQLKSLLNSITPHSITSSIEMKVAQRVQSLGNANIKQLLLIFLAVLGAGGLLYMVIMSVQNGNTGAVVQASAPILKTAASSTLGG